MSSNKKTKITDDMSVSNQSKNRSKPEKHNRNHKDHQSVKIKPMTKQDKQSITKILDKAFDITSPDYDSSNCWIDLLELIDIDVLNRSLSQILNLEIDTLPQELIDSNKSLKNIKESGKKISILNVLSSSNSLFRFAPSPSGYLHIGHFVPILLNILLQSVAKHYGNNTNMIFRIDDTNPDEDDFSDAIHKSLKKLIGTYYDKIIHTRSSFMVDYIINLIDKSIIDESDKFYVDTSDQKTIQEERGLRIRNKYHHMGKKNQVDLWKKLKDKSIDGVVRAKIDMDSNNGNLRDPVMLRFVDIKTDKGSEKKLMPTYDLVCPVLDSLDSSTYDMMMIALRDSNYYDRLGQYYWIQKALNLKPTIVITFSRVSFENVLLSKRKIKQLVHTQVVTSWDDPRLMTIDGIFNRGITLAGLINFYWLTGKMSVGNRPTSQDINTLFDINNKTLSQRNNFVIERMPIKFKIDLSDNIEKYMIVTIKQCNLLSDQYEKIPDLTVVQNLVCLKNRLITYNIRYLMDLLKDKKINENELINGRYIIDHYLLPSNKFKTCADIKINETIKINNFKDLPDDPNFGGYFYVVSKDSVSIHDVKNLGICVNDDTIKDLMHPLSKTEFIDRITVISCS
jgi:glutamyl/glutaminyl-tRNA synthetase